MAAPRSGLHCTSGRSGSGFSDAVRQCPGSLRANPRRMAQPHASSLCATPSPYRNAAAIPSSNPPAKVHPYMVDPTETSLQARLNSGRLVMTAEVVPPVSCDPHDLLHKAAPLKGLADAINVTDGAGARAHMGALAAAAILRQAGIEPILQLTCRDRNRIGLQGDLMGAAALGVRNLLVLTGDKPSAGDQPDAKAVFDLDSKTLS